MSKTYRTPTVATLGAAEVVTRGLVVGPITEPAPFPGSVLTKTTHAMLDL
jgi:hypothetical protein